jgi:hypothetical protein
MSGSPAASEASRSTTATMAKSWLPSGSSTVWRTRHRAAGVVDGQQSRRAACGPRVDRVVLVPIGAQRVFPGGGVHCRAPGALVRGRLQGAQRLEVVAREQLDAPKERVAHHDPEGARVAGDRPWRRDDVARSGRRRGSALDRLRIAQRLPLVEQGRVDLADGLPEPLLDVLEFRGLDVVRHGPTQRAVLLCARSGTAGARHGHLGGARRPARASRAFR